MPVDFSALASLREAHKSRHILDLFAEDAGRASEFSATADGLLFDYAKTLIGGAERAALFDLLDQAGFDDKRAAMF